MAAYAEAIFKKFRLVINNRASLANYTPRSMYGTGDYNGFSLVRIFNAPAGPWRQRTAESKTACSERVIVLPLLTRTQFIIYTCA